MGPALRRTISGWIGWLSDRRLPRWLRAPLFRMYARAYDVELGEVRLALEEHASFAAFFVRRLAEGARQFPEDASSFPSPADGRVQAVGHIERDSMLQAKGMDYSVRELLAGAADDLDLEGAATWTIYLSPRDYHRVHAPESARLTEVRWVPGDRLSVAPKVLERRERVFACNERAVLRLESRRGPLFLVMVGAMNVGRIRVVGVSPRGAVPAAGHDLERGAELARFELGSTVVLVAPRGGPQPSAELQPGQALAMGQEIGRWPTGL